jgi:hypothetical protein
VVKLFYQWRAATWLLSELDTEDPNIAFGLCDLGMGFHRLLVASHKSAGSGQNLR